MSETNTGPDDQHDSMLLAVCGAHLQGMPLHHQLTDRAATLVEATHTASCYQLYALPGDSPRRPGLVRTTEPGTSIEVEVYLIPQQHVGSFLDGIAQPLGLGKLELADGQWVTGFICEPWGIQGATDISEFRGWRAYMESI